MAANQESGIDRPTVTFREGRYFLHTAVGDTPARRDKRRGGCIVAVEQVRHEPVECSQHGSLAFPTLQCHRYRSRTRDALGRSRHARYNGAIPPRPVLALVAIRRNVSRQGAVTPPGGSCGAARPAPGRPRWVLTSVRTARALGYWGWRPIPWCGRAVLKYATYSRSTRRRYPSPRTRTGSRHSRRTLPRKRAGGIRPQWPEGRAQDGAPAAHCDASARGAVLAVVVADAVPGALVEGRGLAQLLGHPSVSRMARHPDVHHAARPEFDDAERDEQPESEGDDLEEVTGPNRIGVVAQEGRPGLPVTGGSRRARGAHVPLDRALAHTDAQLAEFPAEPLGTPPPVRRRQALDGRDRLRRYLRPFGRTA